MSLLESTVKSNFFKKKTISWADWDSFVIESTDEMAMVAKAKSER